MHCAAVVNVSDITANKDIFTALPVKIGVIDKSIQFIYDEHEQFIGLRFTFSISLYIYI